MKTSIDVIVTFHNQKKYIYECVNSILFVAQNCSQYEIKITAIDSGSDDLSSDELENLKSTFKLVKFYKTENLGSSGSKNFGFSKTNLNYITFIDGDDKFLMNRITFGMEKLSRKNSSIIIGTQKYIFEHNLKNKIKLENSNIDNFYLTSMLLERVTFNRVGLFSTNYKIGGDLEWYLRSKRMGFITEFVNKDFVERRVHNENATRNIDLSNKERNMILMEHLHSMKIKK